MNFVDNVCITGLGVVNPSGIGREAFWKNISAGANSIREISKFDCSSFPLRVAGQLLDFKAVDFIPRRFAIKMDPFSHYAWAASSMAIEDAKLNIDELDPYKVGVWFGNNSGGWAICEQGLYELFREGAAAVNPWQATAWFLSSAQGYVSIGHGLKGMSKSFCSDRTSCAAALAFATQAINANRADVILAGGTEAPLTSFGLTCYYETGEFASSKQNNNVFRPFDINRQGMVLGEGSAVLVLENKQHAVSRNAKIYAEILSCALSNDFDPQSWSGLSFAIKKVLERAQLQPSQIDLIMPEGAAVYSSDYAEAMAIKEVFGENTKIPITCIKAGFGHLYGASTATDMVAAILAAANQTIPPTPNIENPDFGLNIVQAPQQNKIRYVLFLSRAREGGNVVILIAVNS